MTTGAFTLWPLDGDGEYIDLHFSSIDQASKDACQVKTEAVGSNNSSVQDAAPNPSDPRAVDIYFGVNSKFVGPQPRDQVELQDKIQKVLRTIQILYPVEGAISEQRKRRFRSYYVRLFRLGQVGLEGDNPSTETASAALTTTIADLIDDEAGNVKTKHLLSLGVNVVRASASCGVLYVLLRLTAAYWKVVDDFLQKMAISPELLGNFLLLLIGSFVGVWLSYAIRTTTFTLSDLTLTDADRLTPSIRLIFAGILTVILGILFSMPLIELRIGNVPMTSIATYPMLAFVVGCFCGISELTLPNAVAKRASDFVQNIK